MQNPTKQQTPKSALYLAGVTAVIVGAFITAADDDFTPPGVRHTYELSNFLKPEDCDAKSCDIYPAWTQVMSICEPEVGAPPGQGERVGCVITLAPGVYRLSQTLRWCRGHIFRGSGGGHWNAATAIHVAKNTSAIVTKFAYECDALDLGFGADAAQITDLALISDGNTGAAPTYGIQVENAFNLMQNLWIRGFTANIFISADVTRKPSTNANGWRIINVTVDQAEHAGIIVKGGDSNVGLADAFNSASNCAKASKWEAILGRCANVIDHSFLGCTWIAAHTAAPYEFYKPWPVGTGTLTPSVYGFATLSVDRALVVGDFMKMTPGGRALVTAINADGTATARVFDRPVGTFSFAYTIPWRSYPGFDFNKAAQRSVCVGCYTESDQLPSILGQNDNVLGGLSTWDGAGSIFQGPHMNALIINNTRDSANPVQIAFGTAADRGTFWEARPVDPTSQQTKHPLRFKYEPAYQCFKEDVANLNSGVVRRIGGATTSPGSYGSQWFSRPPFVGTTPANLVQMIAP